jgi:transcription antitermination factor NusG
MDFGLPRCGRAATVPPRIGLGYGTTGAMPWMVIRTEPRREEFAERQIVGLFHRETYFPKYRDWRTGKIRSLFPSYLFVEVGEWSYLRRVFGVLSPIFVNGNPGVVADDEIEKLQSQHDAEGLILFDLNIGHRVAIVGGEYVGWSGNYHGMTDGQRCQVLFSMIGQPVLKNIDIKHIRADSLHLV